MRDNKIDVLRFIGLAMIVLAHADPPGILFQARNFDVPLMVIIAALSFRVSYKQESYASYLWKRVKRLLLPVWLFLSIYFFEIYLTGYPVTVLSKRMIASSYLLLDGSDYIWIIRIFLLVAIVSPFLFAFCQRMTSSFKYFLVIAAIYLSYELTFLVTQSFLVTHQGYLSEFVKETFLSLAPYAVVFSIGLRLPELGRNQLLIIAITALSIFVIEANILYSIFGYAVQTQDFKYPPQSYYLSYAVAVSIILWISSEKIANLLGGFYISPVIQFVAENTLWIYLWHIPLVEIIIFPFYLKYPIVFSGATLLTFLQVRSVKQALLPKLNSTSLKKNLKLILTG